MTIALALEYIPRRMNELGYGTNYYIRFRHFVLQPSEQLEVDAYNQFFILVEEVADVKVASDFGLFDLAEENTNEQTYEHQGAIVINNTADRINHLRFVQVIPKHSQRLILKTK